MSRVPVGKVLLRNVIRHTGAHNKIQEETEMWKIREWEKQTEETYYWKRQSRMLSDTSSGRMRSDGFDEEGHRAEWKTKNSQFLDPVEEDLLRARSWNKKLYECEANMPDRWFHLLTDGVTVATRSCTLKNLIRIVTSKKGMNKMLSMGRRNLTWAGKPPASRTNGRNQRSRTRRSKKSDPTKNVRKRKRSKGEHHPIPPGTASARKRRLRAPGKGNTSARKRPGKCLPGNLPPPLGRRVTFLMQAAQPPAALRTVSLRRKKRNSPQKRERNVTILCRRGRMKYQRRGARGRTGKWPGMKNQRIAQRRTDEPRLQLKQ
ncbi:uncharacterized protein NKAPD1 isoform 3-T4 [Podargus strigoides]